jgi:hypothetical protein
VEDQILRFMVRRPQYTEQHVRDIALGCDYDGVPFCAECADWHPSSEDHTED